MVILTCLTIGTADLSAVRAREDDQMGWLIAAIVLIALVFFMIISPGFRYFSIALVVLGGLGIYGWIEKEKHDDERRRKDDERRQQAALSAIAPSDIALDQVQLKKEAGSWTLTGNVTNNSKYSLSSLGFMVWVEDCPEWAVVDHVRKECITVGQEIARAYVSVPPGQMRAFSSSAISFKGMPRYIVPTTTNPRWRYEITEIRAQ
jgi:hypothetical protein